jgi:hypothetical protein
MTFIQMVSITATSIFLVLIFRLIIKKRLREEFSVIWILCSLFLNVFAFWREGIEVLARFFGIFYPPSIIFIMLFMALIVYSLHLSIVLSKQKNDIKNLTQEISFINEKLEKKSK